MVTIRQIFDVTDTGKKIVEYAGLAADSKPTDCANGSCFIEIDGDIYFFDEENTTWQKFGA